MKQRKVLWLLLVVLLPLMILGPAQAEPLSVQVRVEPCVWCAQAQAGDVLKSYAATSPSRAFDTATVGAACTATLYVPRTAIFFRLYRGGQLLCTSPIYGSLPCSDGSCTF